MLKNCQFVDGASMKRLGQVFNTSDGNSKSGIGREGEIGDEGDD
jgi:hypothetical protein